MRGLAPPAAHPFGICERLVVRARPSFAVYRGVMYRESARESSFVIVCAAKFVFAIDSESGMTKWAYALRYHPSRAMVAGTRVYVAGDNELAAVELETGRVQFHIVTPFAPDVTLHVDHGLEQDRIYVGAAGKVGCYDKHGVLMWSNDLGQTGGVGFALPGGATQIDLKG